MDDPVETNMGKTKQKNETSNLTSFLFSFGKMGQSLILVGIWLLSDRLTARYILSALSIWGKKRSEECCGDKSTESLPPWGREEKLMLGFRRKELTRAHNGYQTGSGRTIFFGRVVTPRITWRSWNLAGEDFLSLPGHWRSPSCCKSVKLLEKTMCL